MRFEKSGNRRDNIKSFRFLAAWLSDEKFTEFVASYWNSECNYFHATKTFTKDVMVWNKKTFGNIFNRKKRLLALVGGIQKALQRHSSNKLMQHESTPRKELEVVLAQEKNIIVSKFKT